MGVFYDVRVHLADGSEDYTGKKGTTVAMGIRKAQYASFDMKQRSPTATTGRRQHSSVTSSCNKQTYTLELRNDGEGPIAGFKCLL